MLSMDDEIEKVVNTFDKINENTYFMREQLIKKKPSKPAINFENCLITISKNGGMIAFVKKYKVFIMESTNPIKDNIRVFCQDGSNEHRIRFRAESEERHVVHFEFTNDETLYAIMNDGTCNKIEIFSGKVIPKKCTSDSTFEKDNIVTAQYFMNGFAALTVEGNFYLVKDFKNLIPTLFFSMSQFLKINYVPSFAFIPANASKTGKIELFLPLTMECKDTTDINTNNYNVQQFGKGLVNVVDQEKFYFTETMSVNGVYYIRNNTIEPYYDGCGFDEGEDEPGDIGQIHKLAVSPSYKQLALYQKNGTIFLYDIAIENDERPLRKITLKYSSKFKDEKDIEEQKSILDLPEDSQFLFCGEDAVCLAAKRFIFVAPTASEGVHVYRMTNKSAFSGMLEPQFMYCISEVDGLRVLMNDAVYFISQVSNDLYDSCYPFSDYPSKKLVEAYKSALDKEANCDKLIREIYFDLNKAINSLQNAAACLWRNDIQLYLLKAAQHGKKYVQKDDYNFDSFVELCKDIRIVNNLRESSKPRFITYKEYKTLNPLTPKELIKRVLSMGDFYMAYQIAQYLDYDIKEIYQKYAIAQIKNLPSGISENDEVDMFYVLERKLKDVPNISYVELAKKALKYSRQVLSLKFLDKEKSIIIKIPQYLRLKNWDVALRLALQTYDTNVISAVIDKIFRDVDSFESFCGIMSQNEYAQPAIINFLKKNGKPGELFKYLDLACDYETLFFSYLENFFKSTNGSDRKNNLDSAKICLDRMKSSKDIRYQRFDLDFYKKYIEDLEHSLIFKHTLLEKDVIDHNNDDPFDSSVYDIIKLAASSGRWEYDKEIKGFHIPKKKFHLLQLRSLASAGDTQGVSRYNKDYAKYGISGINFAELLIDFKMNDVALEVLKKVNDPDFFDYKVDLLKTAEKFEYALETIIKEKDISDTKRQRMANEIFNKKEGMKNLARDLCQKYQVNLKV